MIQYVNIKRLNFNRTTLIANKYFFRIWLFVIFNNQYLLANNLNENDKQKIQFATY